ncbi:hypothetical protein GCM10028778_07960 [Barrientosiimonas marina]|uniref:DUF2612 domain-containing protein n=1 Tax=Lentibacillus kimchii TaxID=1542911 RepID=A0ABW2UTT3_9BACI
MSLKDKTIHRLTDAYKKAQDSNIAKIIGIMIKPFEELRETFEQIESWRSIDNAEGEVLNDIGRDIDQYRGGANDDIYRIMLKSKVARDFSTADTNTIIDVLAMSLDVPKQEVNITDKWMDEYNPEPAAIKVIEIPIERLNEVGMSSGQFVQIVQRTVAAGVLVKQIELQGTFEYGGTELVQDKDKGFSDLDMTTGGYYGAVYKPENEEKLPV